MAQVWAYPLVSHQWDRDLWGYHRVGKLPTCQNRHVALPRMVAGNGAPLLCARISLKDRLHEPFLQKGSFRCFELFGA